METCDNCRHFVYFCSVDPPEIIQHPESQSVPIGAETKFKVEARGDKLLFQWQKNGCDVHSDNSYSGTDTNTLSIRQVKKSDEGYYRCLVKSEVVHDEVLSKEAQFTVRKFMDIR